MELSDPMTLSYSLMKVKRTENIFHYDFLFLVFLFMLSSFKILVFECSQSPREKLTKLLFIAKAFLLQQNFITRTNKSTVPNTVCTKKV